MKQFSRVGAYALMIRDDEILLCRLSAIVEHAKGMWTLPGGGVEFGEHPRDSMIREVEEETGYVVEAGRTLGVGSLHERRKDHDYHSIRLFFEATVTGGSLRHEAEGTTDMAKWHKLAEVENLPVVSLVREGLRVWHTGN